MSNFPYNRHLFQPGMRVDTTHARIPCFFFLKKMTTSLTHFKWTDVKLVNLVKRSQEY